jgi:hypothetical protein
MIGFTTWCQHGISSCCLFAAALLSSPAQAATADGSTFAQTAMVTHWSLPDPVLGTSPEPRSAHLSDLPPSSLGHTLAPAAAVAAPPTSTHTAELARLALADEDLQARGYVQPEPKEPYRMPRDIKRLQIAFQVLNAADAATTLVCLKQDDCQENNPLYGKHPKPIVVIGAKTLVGAVHYYAMRSLSQDYPGLARALGWVTVSIQGGVVGLNLSQLL